VRLTQLRLSGFKSFAEPTTLSFEPGLTAVVGPNGSGKSNVVDAVQWVLGTHRPSELRGAAMSDVVFAGSRQRRRFGRALVELTIDNTDGSLPVDYEEVTVGRTVFASGEGAYHLGGEEVRQTDVAELLSDAGLGRDGHGVVSQGRIDALLAAGPDERRRLLEEAAGI